MKDELINSRDYKVYQGDHMDLWILECHQNGELKYRWHYADEDTATFVGRKWVECI